MQCSNSTGEFSIATGGFLPVVVVSVGLIALLLTFGVGRRKECNAASSIRPCYLQVSILSGSLLQLTSLIIISCAFHEGFQVHFNNALVALFMVRFGISGICVGYSLVFVSLLLECWRQSKGSFLEKLKDEHIMVIIGMLLIVEVLTLSFWLVSLATGSDTQRQHYICWLVPSKTKGQSEIMMNLTSDIGYWLAGIAMYMIFLAVVLLYKSLVVAVKPKTSCKVGPGLSITLSLSVLTGFSAGVPGILLISSRDVLFILSSFVVITPSAIIAAAQISTKICCVLIPNRSSHDTEKQTTSTKASDEQLLLQIENKLLMKTISENKTTIRSLKSRLTHLEAKTLTLSTSTLHVLRKEKQVWSAPSLLSRKYASDTMLQKTFMDQKTPNVTTLKPGNSDSKNADNLELKSHRGVIDCGGGCYYVTDYSSSSDDDSEWGGFGNNNGTRFQQHVKIIQSVYEKGFSEDRTRVSVDSYTPPARKIRLANWHPSIYKATCDFLSDSESSYSNDYQASVWAQTNRKSETLV